MNETNKEKVVYLTFDDGPDKNTFYILDLLKKYQVKATFFNLGIQEEKYPELVKRVVEEGHALGNHTWTHDPHLYKDKEAFINEVNQVRNLQKEITGKEPERIFRFPFGSDKASKECIKALENEGFNFVDWNVYLEDGSRNPSSEKAYKLAIEGIHSCTDIPVILTHAERPDKTGPVAALEDIIKELKKEGFKFLTFNEKVRLVHLDRKANKN